MTIEFLRPEVDELKPRISVIGVGGAGGNAIANMIQSDVQGVDFVVANTDAQALNASPAEQRIQLGLKITQGLGAGSRPEIGRAAAEETIEAVEKALEGAHMCFIAAGMGGGTGTGAAPVIAKAARDRGILTVGVVTKPFSFEGNRRMKSAEAGIAELQKHVDTLIVIPNQNLFLIANPNTTFKEAFQMADQVLQQGVRGITDLMVMPGLINLDFADVRSVMSEMGKAMMGTGEASGDNRAIEAAEKAIANPLLDGVSMKGARGVIVSITGGDDMRLMEVDEAANHIKELVDPDANIIWGSAFNNDLDGKIRVSVVATGIEVGEQKEAEPAKLFTFPPRTRVDSRPPIEPASASARGYTPPKVDFDTPAAPTLTPPPAPTAAPEPAPKAETPAPLPDLDLTPDAIVSPPKPTATIENDELLLDGGSLEPAPTPAEPSWNAPRATTPAEPVTAPIRPARESGGTLFERMSNLARGGKPAPSEDEPAASRDPLDIPRFLNRQNNQ